MSSVPLLDESVGSTSAFVRWNGGGFFSARGRLFRFAALICICLLTFGSYFCYDIVEFWLWLIQRS